MRTWAIAKRELRCGGCARAILKHEWHVVVQIERPIQEPTWFATAMERTHLQSRRAAIEAGHLRPLVRCQLCVIDDPETPPMPAAAEQVW